MFIASVFLLGFIHEVLIFVQFGSLIIEIFLWVFSMSALPSLIHCLMIVDEGSVVS